MLSASKKSGRTVVEQRGSEVKTTRVFSFQATWKRVSSLKEGRCRASSLASHVVRPLVTATLLKVSIWRFSGKQGWFGNCVSRRDRQLIGSAESCDAHSHSLDDVLQARSNIARVACSPGRIAFFIFHNGRIKWAREAAPEGREIDVSV